MKKFAWALALFVAVQGAAAAVVSADVRTEGDLPHQGATSPKVFEQLAADLSQPVVLDDSTVVANLSDWGGAQTTLTYDASLNVLTLTALDSWDFSTFNILLSNIQFDQADEHITGLSLLHNELTDVDFAPTFTYGRDSIGIHYSVYETSGPDSIFNFVEGNTLQVQVMTSISPVPEVGSWAMMGLGLVGVALVRRRQRA